MCTDLHARMHVTAVASAAPKINAAAAHDDDDHFAPPAAAPAAAVSVPSPAPAAPAPQASPREAQRALAGAVRAAESAEMDKLPGPSAQQRALGRPTSAAGGRGRVGGRAMRSLTHEARASANPVDVAGMLVSDIGKDLGF